MIAYVVELRVFRTKQFGTCKVFISKCILLNEFHWSYYDIVLWVMGKIPNENMLGLTFIGSLKDINDYINRLT